MFGPPESVLTGVVVAVLGLLVDSSSHVILINLFISTVCVSLT